MEERRYWPGTQPSSLPAPPCPYVAPSSSPLPLLGESIWNCASTGHAGEAFCFLDDTREAGGTLKCHISSEHPSVESR